MTLIERLQKLTEAWSSASGKSPATLSSRVVNDGKFFARLEASRTCSIASWERFLVFFRDESNWPDATIPDEAVQLLGEISAIALPGEAQPGKSDDLTASAGPAVCGICELRAEDPAVAACGAPNCGLRALEAA